MEDERRRSRRNIKFNQDPAFSYDDESIKFLVNTSASRGVDNEERHHRNSTESVSSEPIAVADSSIFVSSSEKVAIASPNIWTEVYKSLPLIPNTVSDSINQLSRIPGPRFSKEISALKSHKCTWEIIRYFQTFENIF